MKRIILLSAILCSGLSLSFGQHIMHTLSDLGLYMKSSDYQNQQMRKNAIVGSPYLTEEFASGMLHLKNTWYEDVELKYDIYDDCFEVKLETGTLVIDPKKNDIDTIKYNGEIFVRKVNVSGRKTDVAYMSVLGEYNGYSIYKKYNIIVREAKAPEGYSDAKPAEFRPDSPSYYLYKDKDKWLLSGIKSIAEIFDVDVKMVKSYLKKNKLKLSREEDLFEAVKHFSSIKI